MLGRGKRRLGAEKESLIQVEHVSVSIPARDG